MLDQLDDNQKRALDMMAEPSSPNVFVAWWAMGTGKTRLALAAFYLSDYKDCIIVCRRISFEDWMDEMETIGFNNANCYTNDYQPTNLVKLSCHKNPKRILFLSAGDLKNIPIYFPKGQMLIVDELYLFCNAQAKRSILLRQMSLFCSARIGLSGTIMPSRDNTAIFGQLAALNAHHPLASGTTEFRLRFQVKSKTKYGISYVNKPNSDQAINALISDRVDCYFPESRPTRIQLCKLDKTKEQELAIKELKETYNHKDKSYKYALQIVHAINGISNGWFVNSDNNLEYYKSSKLEKLFSLVDDIVAGGHRVVVWCAYHADISRIAKDLKHPWLEFSGTTPFSSVEWQSGKFSVVLATEAMGASVNHFKHVKYAVYYSINYKYLDLQQSMARHERKGSQHDGAHYYFLQTRGTMDARAYQLVSDSRSTEEEIIKILANESW